MDLILNGTFRNEYDEKEVEINGQPVKYMMAILDTRDGPLPVVAWGDKKVGMVKEAIKNQSAVKIAAVLFAKTYRNEEGKVMPYLQLKLFSFVGFPQPQTALDPTGSFRCFSEEEKDKLMKPMNFPPPTSPILTSPLPGFPPQYEPQKVKPWPV